MKSLMISPIVLWCLIIALTASLGILYVRSFPSEDSPAGLVLPEGDIEKGRQSFVELGCLDCHTVEGVGFGDAAPAERKLNVVLGGDFPMAMSYGKLLTSIIHPSEGIRGDGEAYMEGEGTSKMLDYNSVMTVGELVNIVAFLQEHYSVMSPGYYGYNYQYYQGLEPISYTDPGALVP